MLLWESYLNLIQSPALGAWPLSLLRLAVEGIQFLEKDQLSMRFAIIAVSRSFIWHQFLLSQPHTQKKWACTYTHTHKLNSTAKKGFSFLILDLFWSPGVFCYPMWRIEHWLQPRFALQPQPFWTFLLCTVLFMKRNYLNPQEQEVSSLYFFLCFQ